jgi:hypothetical protein
MIQTRAQPRKKHMYLLLYIPIVLVGFYLLEDALPRYFGFKPWLYVETESSKSRFLAGSLTQSAYLYAELARGSGAGFVYQVDMTDDLESTLGVMGHSIISLTVMDADLKANRGFADPHKLHIRYYAVTGGFRYPIFTNDEIDAEVKSDNPQDFLDYLGVSTDGITGPR